MSSKPINRCMDIRDIMPGGAYVPVIQEIHDFMGTDHSPHTSPGYPCMGKGSWIQGTKHWEYPWLLEALELADLALESKEGFKVLDVGSGGSVWPCYLTYLGYDVTAIDIGHIPVSGQLHSQARETGRFRSIICDVTQEPVFQDRDFTLVTSVCVLEHIEKHVEALWRMSQFLKKDGLIALTIEYTPPGVMVGSRAEWPTPEMQFNEETVPLFIEQAGLSIVGEVDWQPPKPWGQHMAEIPTVFPDSAPVGVLGLLLKPTCDP